MKRDGVRKMRGKAKQRVSLILVVTMVLGTVLTGNNVFAAGESSDEQDRIKINISKDSEQTVEQNVTQTIHVTAQEQRQVQQQSGRTTRTIMEQLLLNICRSQCQQMQ